MIWFYIILFCQNKTTYWFKRHETSTAIYEINENIKWKNIDQSDFSIKNNEKIWMI